jgi:hypothetical protein
MLLLGDIAYSCGVGDPAAARHRHTSADLQQQNNLRCEFEDLRYEARQKVTVAELPQQAIQIPQPTSRCG